MVVLGGGAVSYERGTPVEVCKRHRITHTFCFSLFHSYVQPLSPDTHHRTHTRSRTLSMGALQSLQRVCPLTPSTGLPHLQENAPP